MGLFDGLKKAFGAHGLDIDLIVPDRFDWEDVSLPITVTVSGDDKESRRVNRILVKLVRSDVADDRPGQDAGEFRRVVLEEGIDIVPGNRIERAIEIPIAGAVGEVPAGAIGGALLAAAGIARTLQGGGQRYQVKVALEVEGYNALSWTSSRVLSAGPAFGVSFG